MTVWAVVPLKALDGAKGRLAPLLAPEERAALAEAMLADVVAALQAAESISRVVVVSPSEAVRTVARALGAAALADPPAAAPPVAAEDALNAALDRAATLAEAQGASALLTVPADLPQVGAADVAALLAALPPAPSVVVVPSLDGGTNALLRTPPLAIPARFGAASAGRHLAEAARRGVRARLLWRTALLRDCDQPGELRWLIDPRAGAHARRLVASWRLAERLQSFQELAALETARGG